jgi:hypothetical protein
MPVKQLAPVNNEPALIRQIKQWRKRKHICKVITKDPDIKAAVENMAEFFEPVNNNTLADTLLSCFDQWKDGAFISHGDVVYSESAIDRMASRKDFGFVVHKGDPSRCFEIFGMVIPNSLSASDIKGLLEMFIMHPKYGTDIKLWHLFAHLIGTNWGSSRILQITDWTCDIDHWQGYQQILKEAAK